MRIAVLDDYQDAFRKMPSFARLMDHQVTVYCDTVKGPEELAARLKDMDAVLLTQQRTPFPRAVVEKLPAQLKLITQTGGQVTHIDLAACTERGIALAAAGHGSSHHT